MLVNAPRITQLTPNTNDGMPSNNAQADCAAASVDAAAQALGAPADLTPDYWKDAAYGEAYTGATDPDRYAGALAHFGLAVQEERPGDGNALVAAIRAHLHAGHPVLGAIPSLWGNDYAGQDMVNFAASTHEVCFCDDDGANLTAMNPWPFSWTGNNGWYQTQAYAWWAERLVYGRVNPVVKVGASVAVTDQNMGAGFKAYADAHGLSTPNLTGGEVFNVIDGSYTAWQDAVVLFYRADVGVRADMAGHVVGQLTGRVRALQAQVSALQAQLAAAQAQAAQGVSDPVAKACIAAIQAVKAAQGEL